MLACSLQLKSTESLDDNVKYTSTTRAGLVHDVTDTDCWTQDGSADGSVSATFKCRFQISTQH